MAPLLRPARVISIFLLAVFAAGACSSAATPGPAAPGSTSPAPGAVTSPAPSIERPQKSPPERIPESAGAAPVTGEVPHNVVAGARALLAADAAIGAAANDAALVVAASVTWPDGSLGCPVMGVMYVQIPTPGYHIVFQVGATREDVRATVAGEIRRCAPPVHPTP
jgi:hypothetical protein